MEIGAHLPLIAFDDGVPTLSRLKTYASAAADLGFRFLCANDHLRFSRPWLDGPTALAAVIAESGDLTLATTVSLPVLRGPVPLAKTLAAIDALSGGRVVVGVGPGSSAADYDEVGLTFDERWRRFDEAVPKLRALLGPDSALEPRPLQRPPIWVASWGSAAGLRRVARLGDGWLASAYNTTPESFSAARERLARNLASDGAGGTPFPNAIATAWMYVTDDDGRRERMLSSLARVVNRPLDTIRSLSLPIGPPELCAERLRAFALAGAERIFVWPLADEARQLELFRERVAPLVPAMRSGS